MKKFISIFCLSLLFFSGNAQSNKVVNLLSTYNKTSDTLTNTTPNYLSLPLASKYATISVQPVITKISGTVAGYGVLRASLDGTNYVDIATDSILPTNQTTNTKVWIVDNPGYTNVRFYAVGSGTMAASMKAYMLTQPVAGNYATTTNLISTYSKTSDTITNTATNYVTAQVTNSYTKVVIQPIVTKISGTAAGTVTLQGSNDGTNYVTVSTSYLLGASATMTVTNQTTNTKLFVITGSPYEYYRLSYTGSGTMSCTLKGYLSAK